MKIEPIPGIGAHRALCVHKVRVAAGLATRESRRRQHRQADAGLPIDQCSARGDYLVDGRPMCRAHAGADALAYLIQEGQRA